MAKPRKEDHDMEETKRIMERLVKMPHKPHKDATTGNGPTQPKKITRPKNLSPKKQKRA